MLILQIVFVTCAAAYGLEEEDLNDDIPENVSDEVFEEVEAKSGDLVQVSIITRHGQRTPKDPYPSDPWRHPKYWPEGWLQLTEEGAEQHRSLGHWLRDRYPDFIPAQFRTSEVLVRSTGISRTLASAYALTSALFQNQAIPVHSFPSSSDNLFSPHKNCPAFDREMARFMTTSEVAIEEINRRPFYDWLSVQTGRKVSGLGIAESLYSLLTIELQRGLEVPLWTRSIYPQPLKNLTGRYISRGSATPLLARLRYGSLLKDILHHAKNGGRVSKTRKLLIYSAHDFTLIGLLNCLGQFDGAPPGFAASITFEVRRGTELRGNTVDIFYRNDSVADPKKLVIDECGTPCYVKTLRKVLKAVLPVDIEKECESTKRKMLCSMRTVDDISLLWATALGSAALGALLVVCCTKIIVCGRPPQWRMYQPHIMNCEPSKRNYSTLRGSNYT